MPGTEDPLLTSGQSPKVTMLGQERAFCPSAEGGCHLQKPTFWLYELIIKVERETGWLARLGARLLPVTLLRATSMGGRRPCLIFPEQWALLSGNAPFPQLQVTGTEVLCRSRKHRVNTRGVLSVSEH